MFSIYFIILEVKPCIYKGILLIFCFCKCLIDFFLSSGLGSSSAVRSWWKQDMMSGSQTKRTSLFSTGQPSTTAQSWSSKGSPEVHIFILTIIINLKKSVIIRGCLDTTFSLRIRYRYWPNTISVWITHFYLFCSVKVKSNSEKE